MQPWFSRSGYTRRFPTLAKIGYARQNIMEERAAKRAAKAKQERQKLSKQTEAQAAKGTVKALEGLLQEAIAAKLTEDDLVRHMLQNVKTGRFTAEYYLDMWVRRMTEAGVEGTAVICQKKLSKHTKLPVLDSKPHKFLNVLLTPKIPVCQLEGAVRRGGAGPIPSLP